jgi:cobalt-zinc-cadmium efflux system membrane fusion protein
MKNKFPFSVVVILAIGVVLGFIILKSDSTSLMSLGGGSHKPIQDSETVIRGSHGGRLFSKDDFQIELTIFEKGIPPEFRAYVTDSSSKSIPFSEVKISVELKRLDRVDMIQFNPSGQYLVGDKTVVEPHSFEVFIKALWKGKNFEWNFTSFEARAELSDEAIKNAEIETAIVGPQTIKGTLELPGEIGLDETKVLHIVPRLDGVVKQVFKHLGDKVSKGEALAIIESRELADAKISYLDSLKKAQLAKIDFDRESLIFENTADMLELLERKLDIEEISKQIEDSLIGKNREELISSYAKLSLAKSVFEREKGLFEKGIASESDYLLALEKYKSAEAKFVSLKEKIAFEGKWALRQKKRKYEMESLNLQNSTQKLLALGLTQAEIKSLTKNKGQTFTQYELRATMDGTVIKKHLATGEAVKADDDIFLIADLSEVWATILIPADQINRVALGSQVIVRNKNLGLQSEGKLTYLSSIIDETTRTITGRAVIPNSEKIWRPGTFVDVELVINEKLVPLAIQSKALQPIRDWSVAFVKYGNVFEARPLEIGQNDGEFVEVLSGLKAGEVYASKNSYAVKAEIEKSSAVHAH